MKHRRHFEVVKLKTPKKDWLTGAACEYSLSMTQNGNTTVLDYCYFETEEKAQEEADELNNKFYISDWDQSEVEEFFNSIDFTPLYKKVEELIGMELHFVAALEQPRRGYENYEYFNIQSKENLVDYFPMLKAAWKEMYVQTFNRSLAVKEGTGELAIWGTLDYAYKHQDMGSNGAHILSFWYSVSEGWKIITEIERAEANARRWE